MPDSGRTLRSYRVQGSGGRSTHISGPHHLAVAAQSVRVPRLGHRHLEAQTRVGRAVTDSATAVVLGTVVGVTTAGVTTAGAGVGDSAAGAAVLVGAGASAGDHGGLGAHLGAGVGATLTISTGA